jgi:hypothetical protein
VVESLPDAGTRVRVVLPTGHGAPAAAGFEPKEAA